METMNPQFNDVKKGVRYMRHAPPPFLVPDWAYAIRRIPRNRILITQYLDEVPFSVPIKTKGKVN